MLDLREVLNPSDSGRFHNIFLDNTYLTVLDLKATHFSNFCRPAVCMRQVLKVLLSLSPPASNETNYAYFLLNYVDYFGLLYFIHIFNQVCYAVRNRTLLNVTFFGFCNLTFRNTYIKNE